MRQMLQESIKFHTVKDCENFAFVKIRFIVTRNENTTNNYPVYASYMQSQDESLVDLTT